MATKISDFKIKIAIADDCKITRDLLLGNLHLLKEFKVIIEAPNGKSLLNEIRKATPHVVVMDVRMDGMDGIDATREIININPDIKIIAWSVLTDIHTIYKMLDAGATAFLDKETSLAEFKRCLKAMYDDGYFYNEYFNKSMHESIVRGDKHQYYRVGEIVLTDEEIELTKLVCGGMSCKQIAGEYNECLRKAQIDLKALLDKTKTGCVALLVRFAYLNGIISLKDTSFNKPKDIIKEKPPIKKLKGGKMIR
jgi:DNA-binding NarL/FixJ family response regulator